MKTCLACGQENASDSTFCQQCGRALVLPPATGSPSGDDRTVRWTAPPVLARTEPRRSVPVEELFGTRTRLVIGRAPTCDVCLAHPTVSRHHAVLERLPDGRLTLRNHSSNGVFVEGRRIQDVCLVQDRERIGIGPFLFSVENGIVSSFDSSRGLRLEAQSLEKVVTTAGGIKLKLLDNINLAVEPGEFVCLLGPSGSGKSTLMDCLNGRRRATGGRILANGEDFYRHFDNFRQSLGYVAQKDIVHTQLTVARALSYTAQLRLPTDTSPAELKKRVEEVLREMELEPHRDTLVANLSGGQIKRASLGAELLARPCLLYIDEATSGLDAGTEARMMRLFRRLADEGKSLVCITHNVDNVERSHLVLVLTRGRLIYFGPPHEALAYFHVGRLGDLYDRLGDKDPETWAKEFQDSKFHHEYVAKRLSPPPAEPPAPPAAATQASAAQQQAPPEERRSTGEGEKRNPAVRSPAPRPDLSSSSLLLALVPEPVARPYRPPLWHQFRVLTGRYLELIWNDRRSLRLLLLQAPLVSLFVLLAFVGKDFDEKVPAARKLTEEEKGQLQALVEYGEGLGDKDNVPPLAREGLRALKVAANSNVPVLPYKEITSPRYSYMLLDILAIVVFWLGCNNAAKEIVKEEAIYGRERAVNLGVVPYLGSKFLVLSVVSALQVLLLMLVVYGSMALLQVTLGFSVPPREYCLVYPLQFLVLTLLAMTGVAAGLLMSACVNTPDRANALLPYVLIPQIMLGGLIRVDDSPGLQALAMTLSPVYWGYRGIRCGAGTLPPDFPLHVPYHDSVTLACGALLLQTVVLLLATVWFLRRKDLAHA